MFLGLLWSRLVIWVSYKGGHVLVEHKLDFKASGPGLGPGVDYLDPTLMKSGVSLAAVRR